jgi:hypothetical protein
MRDLLRRLRNLCRDPELPRWVRIVVPLIFILGLAIPGPGDEIAALVVIAYFAKRHRHVLARHGFTAHRPTLAECVALTSLLAIGAVVMAVVAPVL